MRCILSQKEIDIKWLGNVSRLYLYLTTSSSQFGKIIHGHEWDGFFGAVMEIF